MPTELRAIFDQDAVLYDRARPGYPEALFTDLADLTDLAGLHRQARLLEIGPGTGQATFALAGPGARVIAVELGANLAGVLRDRVRNDPTGPDIQVEVAGFEDWPLPDEPFDVVACFTAWHWLDPDRRSARVAAALSATGALATVTTHHVLGGSTGFFTAAQDCYLRWDPATPPGLALSAADEIPPDTDEVDTSADFHPAVRRRYRQDVNYSTAAYLEVLNTYSGHRALSAEQRAGLLADLAALIDDHHDGTITKAYLYELRVAHRRT